MSNKDFELEMKAQVRAKQAPDFKEVNLKAVAGLSEQDLIKRHTIGQVEDQEDADDSKQAETNV